MHYHHYNNTAEYQTVDDYMLAALGLYRRLNAYSRKDTSVYSGLLQEYGYLGFK